MRFVVVALLLASCGSEESVCIPPPCVNGGQDENGCGCICEPGWEGNSCDTLVVAKLVGDYTASGTWNSTDDTSDTWTGDGITIVENEFFLDRVDITFPETAALPYGCIAAGPIVTSGGNLEVSVTGDELTIDSQLAANNLTLAGLGTITDTGLTLFLTGSSTFADDCETMYELALEKL